MQTATNKQVFPSLYEERIVEAVEQKRPSLGPKDDYDFKIRNTVLIEASKIFAEEADKMARRRFGQPPTQELLDRTEDDLKKAIKKVLKQEGLDQFSDEEIHSSFMNFLPSSNG